MLMTLVTCGEILRSAVSVMSQPLRWFFSILVFTFLPRDVMQARSLLSCSVRLSVCLSRSWITSKRINISSKSFHHLVATPFQFFRTKRGADIPTATPLMKALNARVCEKSRFSTIIFTNIQLYISVTVIVRCAHAERQFVSIELSFYPCNVLRDIRRSVSRGNKNVGCST